ncbi:hypothetical protein F5B17DRAFT_404168 [Nemania serpens]|nr:hypothetical protein F5B17DRAFT_404168 [Nemania serpens]
MILTSYPDFPGPHTLLLIIPLFAICFPDELLSHRSARGRCADLAASEHCPARGTQSGTFSYSEQLIDKKRATDDMLALPS